MYQILRRTDHQCILLVNILGEKDDRALECPYLMEVSSSSLLISTFKAVSLYPTSSQSPFSTACTFFFPVLLSIFCPAAFIHLRPRPTQLFDCVLHCARFPSSGRTKGLAQTGASLPFKALPPPPPPPPPFRQ